MARNSTNYTCDVAMTGGTIVDSANGRLLRGHGVLVTDDRITGILPNDAVTAIVAKQFIDVSGKYLMPGLVDMHVHVGLAALMEDRLQEPKQAAVEELALFASYGVTRVRNMAGAPFHSVLSYDLESGRIVGPRLHSTSAILDGEKPVWPFGKPIADRQAAVAAVQEAKDQGFEAIKVYNHLSAESYQAVIEAAAETEMPVVGHVPFDVGLAGCLNAQQYSIEHYRGYDIADGRDPNKLSWIERAESWLNYSEEKLESMVETTLRSGVWNCPTFSVMGAAIELAKGKHDEVRERLRQMPSETRSMMVQSISEIPKCPETYDVLCCSLERQKKFTKMLANAGGKLLAGTDAGVLSIMHGSSLHDELAHLADAGLSNAEVLVIGSQAPARYYHSEDSWGSIMKGHLADLAVIEGNPLEDISATRGVFGCLIRGKWHQFHDVNLTR